MPQDVAKPGVKLITAAVYVPIGSYARLLFAKMAGDPAYGQDFYQRALANIASEEATARDVVTRIALGEGDAGVVYASDVTPAVAGSVKVIPIPESLQIIAQYPIAVCQQRGERTGGAGLHRLSCSPTRDRPSCVNGASSRCRSRAGWRWPTLHHPGVRAHSPHPEEAAWSRSATRRSGSFAPPIPPSRVCRCRTSARRRSRPRSRLAPEYAAGLRDLEGFSHLILLCHLHQMRDYALMVRPYIGGPDGPERGIFATRSPKRPNPIALTIVRLIAVTGATLTVAGVDLLDGTPLLDIKPYVPAFDARDAERTGWFADVIDRAAHTRADERFHR